MVRGPAHPVVMLMEGQEGRGSGVVIADDWILTAAHVLPIDTANGLPVTESFAHPWLDLALVHVPGVKGNGLILSSEMPEMHDPVSAYGWWLGYQLQKVDGYAGELWGQMSAPVIHGCSGGAVVNARGELIGIIATVGYYRTQMGDGYAITHVAGYTPIDDGVLGWISEVLHPAPAEAK